LIVSQQPNLGVDADAPRVLAAAYRATSEARFELELRRKLAALSSTTFPDFVSSDTADTLNLIALSGVNVPDTSTLQRYIYQQRLAGGGLVDPGQESGVSVGYAAALVREVLGAEPMLADPTSKLRGASSILQAAEGAFESASLG